MTRKGMALLGVDIGTQGIKAALFDLSGHLLASTFRKSCLAQPSPGVVEEDPEFQFHSVCEVIAEVMRQAGEVEVLAMGVSGQMAGVIGIGRDGHHLTHYDSWLDTRCAPYITQMLEQAGDEIIRKTGGAPSFNHGPKILWWKSEHSEIYEQIAAFVQPGAYAAMRLCSLDSDQAFIDRSYLHFSGFADNLHACWDASLCERFGVAMDKLPRIVESHKIIGTVSEASAALCGLRAGVPVIAGCGDTAASFLAAGATRSGVCVDVAGTASVFASTTTRFCGDTDHRTLGWSCSAVPGLWHPYAYINGGGMNLEWFAKEFGDDSSLREDSCAASKPPVSRTVTLEYLNQLASRLIPSSDDPIFIPHLSGRVCPSQSALRGVWAGLTWTHTRAHLYRSILEAVALEYGIYRDRLKELNPDLVIREIRITGGGEKSMLWNQIKSDALGMKAMRVDRSEGGPLGVAMLAGFGVKYFASLDEVAQQWIIPVDAAEPNDALTSHYTARRARYQKLIDLASQF